MCVCVCVCVCVRVFVCRPVMALSLQVEGIGFSSGCLGLGRGDLKSRLLVAPDDCRVVPAGHTRQTHKARHIRQTRTTHTYKAYILIVLSTIIIIQGIHVNDR